MTFQVDSLDDADRYGLVLLALSRSAWQASSLGGGDAGAFGPAVNAMKVLQVWVRDLGDGCWDGKAGTTPLSYGGPSLLSDEATRLHLAQALVAYLAGAQNQTQLASAADVLPLLDTLATGGGNTAPGACPGTNHLFDDDGAPFDREGPVITWGAFPPSDPFVRGTVTVTASAVDNLPSAPSLLFTSGQTDIDVASSAVRATIDTTTLADGPIPLAVRATDGSGNVSLASHDLIADNTAPTIAITAPAADGLFLRPPVTLGWSVADANLATSSATLDAATTVTPGFQVAAEGPHALAVSASDRAGGASSASRTFTIDSTAPVLSVTAPAHGSFVRGPVTLSFSVSDANPGASAAATLDGAPFTSGASINTEGPHTLVVNATDAAGNLAATVTRAFTLDNTPPVITVSNVSGFVRGPVTLTYSATDNYPPATVTATLDGVAFSSGGQVNTEGAHVLVVNATDQAGNTAPPITRTFSVDNTAPTISSVVAPSGTIVKPPLTITATATDNLMATGSLGADLVVTSAPAPSSTTPGSTGGNRSLAASWTSLPDGPFTARFNLADRAGNAATEHVVTRTIDGTAPTLTWNLATTAGAYWVTTTTPALTGTVADTNLGTVIVSWPGGSITASVTAGSWTATLPAAATLGLAGLDVTVTASDLAGNTTTLTRRLRADITPPVVGFLDTAVRQEDHDNVTFDPTLDSTYNVKKYNPTHAHSAAFSTTLGPATPCNASAPSVVKYAYLLDQAPLYAIESGGTDPGGANALKWHIDPSDDGIGLASVRWRVVDVATSAIIHDWSSLASLTATLVPLYRTGTNGAAALGTAQGLLRFEVEATDQLNRTTAVSRCWNQRLLAAPIVLDPDDQAALPSNSAADIAAGKWGLSSLSLASSTVPPAPVSMMLTSGANRGAGLFEFPIYNPTNESVYVSVDLDLPSAATYTRTSYDGRWVYREATTTTNCGAVQSDPGPPAIYEPNYALAGCDNTLPSGNDPTQYSDTLQPLPPSDFTIRTWTSDQTTTTLTELTQCAGCSSTPAGADRTRVTILVPPRGTAVTRPPVKVMLMATLRPNTIYRPHGSTADPIEFAVGGGGGQRLTGQAIASATQCVQWSRPPGSTSSSAFQCTRTRYYTRARYLDSISVQGVSARTVFLATGNTGTSTTTDIPHLPSAASQRIYNPPGQIIWNTAEPTPSSL